MNYLPSQYELVNDKKVLPRPNNVGWTVYGVHGCPYCQKTATHFKTNNIGYTFHNMKDYSRKELRDMAEGQTTVPVIYKDGRLVGGYSDL